MPRYIDQAPKTPHQNTDQLTEPEKPQKHPEKGSPGYDPQFPHEKWIHDAIADGTVVHYEQPANQEDILDTSPVPSPASTNEKVDHKAPFWTRGKKAIAGTALSIAVLGGGGVVYAEQNSPVKVAQNLKDQIEAEQQVDTLSTMAPADFFDDSVSETQRVKWGDDIITERTPTELPRLNAHLTSANFSNIPLENLTPSLDNTAQQIVDQRVLAEWIVATDTDESEGEKLAATFISTQDQTYNDSISRIKAGRVLRYDISISDKTKTPMESKVFYHTTVGDNYTPNNTPTKIFNFIGSDVNGKLFAVQEIAKFEEGRWVAQQSLSPGDPNWILYPNLADLE